MERRCGCGAELEFARASWPPVLDDGSAESFPVRAFFGCGVGADARSWSRCRCRPFEFGRDAEAGGSLADGVVSCAGVLLAALWCFAWGPFWRVLWIWTKREVFVDV